MFTLSLTPHLRLSGQIMTLNFKILIHPTTLKILQQFTCSHTPQQKDTIERKYQHLLNIAKALRFESKVPLSLLGDCFLTATHLISMLPSLVLDYKSIYEILYQKSPDYSTIKAFGCLCYISNLYDPPDKFAPRSLKCIFSRLPF